MSLDAYYDRQGKKIDQTSWMRLHSQNSYKILIQTYQDDIQVSTVWLGIDHGYGNGDPLIFETMVFGGPYDEYQLRYSYEEDAIRGHNDTCEKVLRKTTIINEASTVTFIPEDQPI